LRSNGLSSAAAQNGRQHFLDLRCYTCHGGPDLTDSAYGELHDVGTLKPSSGNRLGQPLTGIDTPTLRGIAGTAPYLHDGSASDLAGVFDPSNAPPGSPHAAFQTLTSPQQSELLEFLRELDGAESAMLPASPRLNMSIAPAALTLKWPGAASMFNLLTSTNLTPPVMWTPVTNSAQSNAGIFSLTLPATNASRFFLLQGQ
jgi:hypothetical protein